MDPSNPNSNWKSVDLEMEQFVGRKLVLSHLAIEAYVFFRISSFVPTTTQLNKIFTKLQKA